MWRLVSCVLLALIASPVMAASPIAFDTWLRDRAAPQLAEVLAKHPKFKGERVRFVGVRDGRPAEIGDELTAKARRVLTHRVLKQGSNDVVGVESRGCGRPGQRETYLIGIEIRKSGSRYYEVDLAVMDVAEGIWVAGVSLNWRGRLNSAERAALQQKHGRAPVGSMDRPLSLNDGERITDLMLEQIRCSLPSGLDGTVSLPLPEDAKLHLLSRKLEQRLVREPRIVLSDAGQAGTWQINMALVTSAAMPGQLVLSLAPADDPAATQRLAQIAVRVKTSPESATPVADSPSVVHVPIELPEGSEARLLSDIEARQRCSDRRSACAQVGFELRDDAYVLVFRTHAAKVAAASCSARLQRREQGELSFRVQLSGANRTGFYVVASRERDVIRELERMVRRSSAACSNSRSVTTQGLLQAVARLQSRLEWRAIHLTADSSAVGFRRI